MASEEELRSIVDDALPLVRAFAQGRYAVSIGGSHGKGIASPDSDVDFRLFCDRESPDTAERRSAQTAFDALILTWRARGVEVDGCWIRRVEEVERDLAAWLAGEARPGPLVWTVWGYHLPTDLLHQRILDDRAGLVAGWQARLRPYPPALKDALLDRHVASLAYWRQDYHYRNKARRGDAVFLAALASRLVHDLLQVLFALNQTYFPGDGDLLVLSRHFAVKPDRFEERVETALYPAASNDRYDRQRTALLALIDDVLALAKCAPLDACPVPG